AQHKLAITF
ncbi:aldehyde dehydrogenase family protein, partial [Vibrio parahaemolyticus V-223/04]